MNNGPFFAAWNWRVAKAGKADKPEKGASPKVRLVKVTKRTKENYGTHAQDWWVVGKDAAGDTHEGWESDFEIDEWSMTAKHEPYTPDAIDLICAECGAKNVRLWREYGVAVNKIELLCCNCAEERTDKKCKLSPAGTTAYSDQIGYMVPAVPTNNGWNSFWGYTSVPSDAVAWWHSLPLRPTMKEKPMQSSKRSQEFSAAIHPDSDSELDRAIDWIGGNLNPEDVFSAGDLKTWATDNGFVEES